MKSGSSSSYRAALSGTGADMGGERDDEPENINEAECKTCLGNGRIGDADTGEMRKCLDCSGRGKVPQPYNPLSHHYKPETEE